MKNWGDTCIVKVKLNLSTFLHIRFQYNNRTDVKSPNFISVERVLRIWYSVHPVMNILLIIREF